MRTIKVGQFDAVITIFNSIGHLTKADFELTLRNICTHLKDGGMYIFDIFNASAMTGQVVSDLVMDFEKVVNGARICNTQYSTFDHVNGLLTSYDNLTIQKDNDEKKFTNQFSLQIYTAQELQEMLARNGFDVLGQYGFDGLAFVENKSFAIFTVAKKTIIVSLDILIKWYFL